MYDTIDDAAYLASIAVHEAGHYTAARAVGGRIESAFVKLTQRPDGLYVGGEVRHRAPNVNDYNARAIVSAAGPLAQAMYQGRTFDECLKESEGDHANLCALAESAGRGADGFIAQAGNAARKLLHENWPEVLRVAEQLARAAK